MPYPGTSACPEHGAGLYRSLKRFVVLRVPWVTRSVIRAPFKRFRFLRAAVVSRSLTVTVPAPFAVADPMATTTDLLLLRTFAGTRPASLTLPARATLTLIGTPLGPASAFASRRACSVPLAPGLLCLPPS